MAGVFGSFFLQQRAESVADAAAKQVQGVLSSTVGMGFGILGQLKQNTTMLYVLALVAIVLGLFMCFAGKRFFRLCIGIIGGIAGAVTSVVALKLLAKVEITFESNTTAAIVGASALLAGILFVALWRWGLLAAGGFAGFTVATFIMSSLGLQFAIGSIATVVLVAVSIVIGVLLMRIFETVVSIVATSAGGSILTFLGCDYFIGSHYAHSIYEVAVGPNNIDITTNETEVYMFAGTAALAVCGFVVQIISSLPSRKH